MQTQDANNFLLKTKKPGTKVRRVLSYKFFERPAPEVAEDLIGKYLVRKKGGKTESYMITETEGYEGSEDRASHASRGRTKRVEPMFGRPGNFYIYLVYGMYHMLNIVTGKEGHPAAVLIRSVKEIMGPGRLTKTFSVGKKFNGQPAKPLIGLWFEDGGEKINKKDIMKTSRIGVAYAGPVWSKKPWRFVYKK